MPDLARNQVLDHARLSNPLSSYIKKKNARHRKIKNFIALTAFHTIEIKIITYAMQKKNNGLNFKNIPWEL